MFMFVALVRVRVRMYNNTILLHAESTYIYIYNNVYIIIYMCVNGTRVTCKRGTIGTKIKRRKIPFNRLDGGGSRHIHVRYYYYYYNGMRVRDAVRVTMDRRSLRRSSVQTLPLDSRTRGAYTYDVFPRSIYFSAK